MSSFRGVSEGRVYVGNLPPDIRTRDIEDLFYKYGKISFIDLKNRLGPPFAFVEFEDPRDADDAVRSRNGYNYDGYTLRVEFPKYNGRSSGVTSVRGRGISTPTTTVTNPRNGGPPARRSDYRVLISGLPSTGSWQDIKDHMREAGDVCYADVYKDGTGVVEFLRYEDMKYAVRKLDDSKFRSHEGEVSYIRVKEDYRGGRSKSRSRSRSPPSHSRASPSYSPMRRSRSPY